MCLVPAQVTYYLQHHTPELSLGRKLLDRSVSYQGVSVLSSPLAMAIIKHENMIITFSFIHFNISMD